MWWLIVLAICGSAMPVIDTWNGGPKMPDYHRLVIDCETLTHTYGRNAAWGRWEASLAEAGMRRDGSSLVVWCAEGASCIRTGALKATPDRKPTHTVPFASEADALRMMERIGELSDACGKWNSPF